MSQGAAKQGLALRGALATVDAYAHMAKLPYDVIAKGIVGVGTKAMLDRALWVAKVPKGRNPEKARGGQ